MEGGNWLWDLFFLIHNCDCNSVEVQAPRRFDTTVLSGAPELTAGSTGRLRAPHIQTKLLTLFYCLIFIPKALKLKFTWVWDEIGDDIFCEFLWFLLLC